MTDKTMTEDRDILDVAKPADADGADAGEESCAPDLPALGEAHGLGQAAVTASALPPEELDRLTQDLVAAIKTVYDPEIPVDIYELGLIYRVDISDDRAVTVDMTLTAPGCPVAGEMPIWVQNAVAAVEGVSNVEVNMVFDPPWDPSRMSDEARVALNFW